MARKAVLAWCVALSATKNLISAASARGALTTSTEHLAISETKSETLLSSWRVSAVDASKTRCWVDSPREPRTTRVAPRCAASETMMVRASPSSTAVVTAVSPASWSSF
eukprot:Amastigsp_a4191_29.p4 type:complete len:109 gc:universal Amastigsp_a4191_29:703-377(-)